MGLQQNKNEQISVGHFGGKHAMGNGSVPIIFCGSAFFLWPSTKMRSFL